MPEKMTAAEKKSTLHLAVLDKLLELVIASLSLVAALAWNDAIQSLFKIIFGDASSVYAKFFYAILISAVVILLTLRMTKVTKRLRDRLEEG